MALDPATRDLLQIYTDPTLEPAEKIRRLTNAGAPPAATPDLRLAGAGAPAAEDLVIPSGGGGFSGANPELLQSHQSIESEALERSSETDRERTRIEPPGEDRFAADDGGELEGEPDARGVSPANYRQALTRGAMLLERGVGGPAKPQEKVQIEEQITSGSLSPEHAQGLLKAMEQRDNTALEAQRMEAERDQGAAQVRLLAMEQAERERRELAEIQRRGAEEAARIRARQAQISLEIANAETPEEGLFVGQNFGEKVLTFISALAFGAGSGATGTAQDIVPTLTNFARREVDRHERLIRAKKGQIDALGTVLERHLANTGDLETAKKQAMADILARGELEAVRSITQSTPAITAQKLQATAAALNATRMQLQAEIDAQLGDKIVRSTARQFVRERTVEAPPAPAAPQAPAAPAPELTGEELDSADRMSPEDRALAAELDAAGQTQLAGIRGEPAPAPPPRGAGPRPGRPVPTKPAGEEADDWRTRAAELHAAGRTDEAIATMPTGARQQLATLVKRIQKETPGTTVDEALDQAMSVFQFRGPESARLIPQTARDRVVTLGDGRRLFAPSKGAAEATQARIDKYDQAIASAQKLMRYADMPGRQLDDTLRSEIESEATALMFLMSSAGEQGVVRDAELPLWQAMSGGSLGQFVFDPRKNPKASLNATLQRLRRERSQIIGNLSPDPTLEGGANVQRREAR